MGNLGSSRAIVRFGDFELDQNARELRRKGIRVRLQDRPLQVLEILLEQPGKVIAREELQRRIWSSNIFVDFDHGINNAIKRLREALGDIAEKPKFVETIARRGYRFIGNIACEGQKIRSLAVLPLDNLSNDPVQDYFADGLTEALITTLAKIGELRVVSRSSSMLYKGARRPLRDIARELGVDVIVAGTVLRVENRVRVTAQLIDPVNEVHLWAESYERHLHQILDVQSEVAQAIVREVRATLTPEERVRIAKVYPVHPEAYEDYLKGQYHWNRRPVEFQEAIQCFQRAIAKDPDYAVAYAGLADCLCGLTSWGLLSRTEGSMKAKEVAQRALEIDAGLSEAHASLALAMMYDYEFPDAEREFERALELNPRYALAHQFFGFYLSMMGRHEEAYTEAHRALRLDPLSTSINASLAFTYVYARRYDEAIEQCVRALNLDPHSGALYGALGWAYRCKGMYPLAIECLQKRCQLWPGPVPTAWLGETYAAAGKKDEAVKILQDLEHLGKQQYVTPYGIARIYAGLGERDETFRWLETAFEERAEWMVLLSIDPCFDDYHSALPFQDLMCRMKFVTQPLSPSHSGEGGQRLKNH